MGSSRHFTWPKILIVSTVIAVAVAVGFLYFPNRTVVNTTSGPTCRIRPLDANERDTPPPVPVATEWFHPAPPPPPIPPDQRDNPLMMSHKMAVVRFENTTDHPLSLYVVQSMLSLFPPQPQPTRRHTVIVEVEVCDPAGNVIQVRDFTRSLAPDSVPPAADLRSKAATVFVFQPGEWVEAPVALLGTLPLLINPSKQTLPQGPLQPGTYTVRAVVSYAEAPDGEKSTVTSDAVLVVVTEAHIKAAQAHSSRKP